MIRFIGYILFYILGFTGAYILAMIVFPVPITKDKVLVFTLSEELILNQSLFLHLSIGVFFISLVHLSSRLMSVKISPGNSILAILLMINMFCFVIGINIPMLYTTKLWIIKENLSLIQVLLNLWLKGDSELFYIILIFTFVIPILKMIAMSIDIFFSKKDSKENQFFLLLNKWAMLDVLIVGVIVSTMKSGSGFVEMTTGRGLTFFIASIFLSLVISTCLPYTKNS